VVVVVVVDVLVEESGSAVVVVSLESGSVVVVVSSVTHPGSRSKAANMSVRPAFIVNYTRVEIKAGRWPKPLFL
jgi:hypothetical protein